MGQGNYVAVVYGTLNVPDVDFDELDDDYRAMPHRQYEARQEWCGFTVAASEGMADPGELDLERFAIKLEGLREHIETHAAEALASARAKWDAWREKHPEFPAGELLFVADYD